MGFPPDLFSQLFPIMLPFFCNAINNSLSTGIFPDSMKTAVVKPLLKNQSLNPEELNSYRPVSNLTFLSKMIETVVARQLMQHINDNKLFHSNQSAYRQLHSVETALLQVSSSIISKLDQGRVVFLVLLDLSAAFDTIEHKTLLNVLSGKFNIQGTVMEWLKSYLANRNYKISIGNSLGDEIPLKCGVPQGSVMGPILFNCLMTDLLNCLTSIGIDAHCYADDTQLWV